MAKMTWVNARTVLASAVVAAVTATVLAGGPAMARSSSPAITTPVVVAGYKNGPVTVPGPGIRTVAHMHVGAGSWAIFGKAYLMNFSNFSVLADCYLVAGGDFDRTAPVLEENGTSSFSQSIALNVVHRFSSGGTVKFECNANTANIAVNYIKITAVKAGSLTNNPIS